MSILDSIKLRFSNPERLQDLARREVSLQERAQGVAARAQNLAYREEKAKTEPQSVLDAIRTDAQRNAEEAEHAKAADKLKRAFGLQSGDLIDTPEMRHALEAELGRLDVEQDERARQIADRAALLAGLEQLAMIDAARARSILQEYKEVSEQKSYSRDEIASMLDAATARKGGREYSGDLDGWAKSIADRERDLRREEILLDQREKALMKKLERELGIESATAAPAISAAVAGEVVQRSQPSIGAEAVREVVPAHIPVAGEPGQRVQEERIAEVANSGAPVVEATPTGGVADGKEQEGKQVAGQGAEQPRAAAEYTLKELEDPSRMKVVAAEIAHRTGRPLSEVSNDLRDMLANVSKEVTPDKAVLDEARRRFWAGGSERGQDAAAEKGSPGATAIAADPSEKTTKSSAAAVGKAALDVLPAMDAKAVAAIAEAQKAGREKTGDGLEAAEGGNAKRGRGVVGFKSLGRNKSASAAEVEAHVEVSQLPAAEAGPKDTPARKKSAPAKVAAPSEGQAVVANGADQAQGNAGAPSRSRAKFRDLSPEQKAERRTEYMQGLRQDAGLTADGKDVVKEKGKEVGKRRGKQVDGVGL
ncbi:hypothetical protein [Burkholderia contaminans]|uniref:hypothetical protein n=1 Tax=Burkholderia contaminans TaxID=488447 RepID=UPI001F13E6BF|nr:hypothetical protein [Burkholderia contaminans]UMY33515.1 hypothetical protein MMB18_38155 [Burkholderia contaminans]